MTLPRLGLVIVVTKLEVIAEDQLVEFFDVDLGVGLTSSFLPFLKLQLLLLFFEVLIDKHAVLDESLWNEWEKSGAIVEGAECLLVYNSLRVNVNLEEQGALTGFAWD